jgi:hypothetical protein
MLRPGLPPGYINRFNSPLRMADSQKVITLLKARAQPDTPSEVAFHYPDI